MSNNKEGGSFWWDIFIPLCVVLWIVNFVIMFFKFHPFIATVPHFVITAIFTLFLIVNAISCFVSESVNIYENLDENNKKRVHHIAACGIKATSEHLRTKNKWLNDFLLECEKRRKNGL